MLKGLYRVLNADTHEVKVLLCDETHPIFKAHFPSNPILPAFTHIEIIADVFSLEITTIKKAKFSAIVTPNTELHYIRDNSKVRVIAGETLVANFSF